MRDARPRFIAVELRAQTRNAELPTVATLTPHLFVIHVTPSLASA